MRWQIPDRPAEALAAWGLDDPTPAEVEAAWRQLRSLTHPDRSGDDASFAEASAQYQLIKAWAERLRVCASCQGAGRVNLSQSFRDLWATCNACAGSGLKEL